jgi:hypothetical protein
MSEVLAALTVAALAASFINSTHHSLKPFQYESVYTVTMPSLAPNTYAVHNISQYDYIKFTFAFDHLSKFYPLLFTAHLQEQVAKNQREVSRPFFAVLYQLCLSMSLQKVKGQ